MYEADQDGYPLDHPYNPKFLLDWFTGIFNTFKEITDGVIIILICKNKINVSAFCLFHFTAIIKTGKDSFSQQPISLSECQEISCRPYKNNPEG